MLFLLRGSCGGCGAERVHVHGVVGRARHAPCGAEPGWPAGAGRRWARGARLRERRAPLRRVRQSMAATRHRSTARRFVRSACRFMASIVGTDGAPVSPACPYSETRSSAIWDGITRSAGGSRRASGRGTPDARLVGGRRSSLPAAPDGRVRRSPSLRVRRAPAQPASSTSLPCTVHVDALAPWPRPCPACSPAGSPSIFRSKSVLLADLLLEAGDALAGHLVGAHPDGVALAADRAAPCWCTAARRASGPGRPPRGRPSPCPSVARRRRLTVDAGRRGRASGPRT